MLLLTHVWSTFPLLRVNLVRIPLVALGMVRLVKSRVTWMVNPILFGFVSWLR